MRTARAGNSRAAAPGSGRFHRLGMAVDALDLRRTSLQRALQRIDAVMDVVDGKLRIDAAVEVDDLAVLGLAHAHVVHVADAAAIGGEFAQRDRYGADALGRRFP